MLFRSENVFASARNLFITRYFDDAMRRIFKKKWLDFKIEMAKKRAQKAIRKRN